MLRLFRLCAYLPLPLLHALGVLLGWIVFACSPTYRRRFRENTRQAGVPAKQVRRAIGEAGKLVTELPWLWLRPAAQKVPKISWRGEERLEAALAQGKGVIFMTPHVGSFEAVPQAQAARFSPRYGDMTILYRPSRFAWIDTLLKEVRSAPGLEPAPTTTGGVRVIMKALRQGRVVGLLPDQVPGEGQGVWAPFFGRPAYTMTLALRLARQSGAPMLVALSERLSWGRGYVVHVEPLELPLDQGDEVAAAAMNAAMERLILKRAGMYLWSYARYKKPRVTPMETAASKTANP
ncbi:lysophospholipid acyltransferase family protein [Variovorax sp. HJSM1_2]|uniref:lysophospholipid acyltransferase family protein n=1 Tax=Variovorax sp. HJSM1_2 TaxID=3366263 RepID=UPI003BE0896B